MQIRSFRSTCLLFSLTLAIVAAFFFFAASSLSATRTPQPVALFVDLKDTGKTVALGVGQQLVVKLPIRTDRNDAWHVRLNSGPGLKLVAGPDELRPVHWSPWRFSFLVFYFQRQSPGTVDLVLEPDYFLKPMVLKVVDR